MECWFFLYSKRVQILKIEYKYVKHCTPLTQSGCRCFFVLAIICNIGNYLIKRQSERHRIIISKYSMSFCLIWEIIHHSWILYYWGWVISILNKKMHGIFVLLYATNIKQDMGR